MSSISVNGKGRPKATIQATQGDPSVAPPTIPLPVWGRNGLQPPIEDRLSGRSNSGRKRTTVASVRGWPAATISIGTGQTVLG